MNDILRSTHTDAEAPEAIVADLVRELGDAPPAVALFFAPTRNGEEVVRLLAAQWPSTKIIACSTAGEISTQRATSGGVSAAALQSGLVKRCAVATADFHGGLAKGMAGAIGRLEDTFGPLKNLDPKTHIGIVFIDSAHGVEEATNIALGNSAPLLGFVGGSAGDECLFQRTRVATNDGASDYGCALMVIEALRPFRVSKACHFGPTGVSFTVTKSDGRRLVEIDGKPASEVYAKHIGVTPEELSLQTVFMHPAGMMIEGEPWLRQCVPPVQENGSITLGCEVPEGTVLHFMTPRIPLIEHLRSELAKARETLGEIKGGLFFDCALRRFELDATNMKKQYADLIDFPAAGFHTHGESWLGYMHQTLTAIYFG